MAIGEKILGFLTGGFAERGVELIKEVVKDKDLAERLAADFRRLCATQQHDLEMRLIEAEQSAESEFQATVREELRQNDYYTKRTRPNIARKSFYLSAAYVLLSVASKLVPAVPDFETEWAVLTLLASPVLTYMGVRGFEKWKHGDVV